MKSDPNKPASVLFKMPIQMLAALDQVAGEMRQTRSSIIREAIHERIARYEREERAIILMLRQQAEAAYGSRQPEDDQ